MNAAYAREYQDFVARVRAREESLGRGTRLSQAVARYLFKLMAYKDEYEVARLHTGAEFRQQLHAQFEGRLHLTYHLAPPTLAKTRMGIQAATTGGTAPVSPRDITRPSEMK